MPQFRFKHFALSHDRSTMKIGTDAMLLAALCDASNARRILERQDNLSLEAIATEAGYYLHHAHNAFNDVWAEVSIFTFLKKIEAQKGEE